MNKNIEFLDRLKLILNEEIDFNFTEKLAKYSLKDVVNILKKYEENEPDKKRKKLIDLLNKGKEDGSITDDKIEVSEFYIKVKNLQPTQSEIDLLKSIGVILTPKAREKDINVKEFLTYILMDGKAKQFFKNKILIANGKYIIDGHHRWSQVFILNPDAEIPVINFDFKTQKITDILKYFQIVIFATFKNIAIKTTNENTNVFELSEKELNALLDEILDDMTQDALEVFKEFFAIENKNDLKDEIFLYLKQNISLFKNIYKNKISKLPPRNLMPQPTNSAKKQGIKEKDALDMLKRKLSSGEIDLSKPFFKKENK